MCNNYRLMVDVASIIEEFADLKIRIRFPEARPNLEAREDIKITELGPIVRGVGREFTSNRCLVIADGFYEYTDPTSEVKKRKDKWLFQKIGGPIFAVAGIWRETKEVGEAFTMLTIEPGPDIAPYHDQQIVILERSAWADWLDTTVSARPLIRPLPAGSLSVEQIG